MHARAVVAIERLGHERRAAPVAKRDVLDHVFEPQQLVRHRHQRVELHVDLALTGGGDFVVRGLDLDADQPCSEARDDEQDQSRKDTVPS